MGGVVVGAEVLVGVLFEVGQGVGFGDGGEGQGQEEEEEKGEELQHGYNIMVLRGDI